MKTFAVIKGSMISEKLTFYMKDIPSKLVESCDEFDVFSEEAILFACLEYSMHPRNNSGIERIIYLYGKAYLFDNGEDCNNIPSCTYDLTFNKYHIKVQSELPF